MKSQSHLVSVKRLMSSQANGFAIFSNPIFPGVLSGYPSIHTYKLCLNHQSLSPDYLAHT
jgi:hypothetical protein